MNKLLKSFFFEIVIYDETEFFREWDDDEFNYPYVKRKNLIYSNKFYFDDYETYLSGNDYKIDKYNIKFIRSETCLEGSFWSELSFFNDVLEMVFPESWFPE